MKAPIQNVLVSAVILLGPMCWCAKTADWPSKEVDESKGTVIQLKGGKLTQEPLGYLVQHGHPVTLEVSQKGKGLRYQWQRNFEAITGATSSRFVIPHLGTNQLGYYTCLVTKDISKEGLQETAWGITGPVALASYTTNGTGIIIVQHLPPPGGAGTGTSCPKPYVGYVNFRKTVSPFGWKPKPGVTQGSARHLNFATTDVKFAAGTIQGCGTNGSVNVTPMDPNRAYRFVVYFPSNNFTSVPGEIQQLELIGFQP